MLPHGGAIDLRCKMVRVSETDVEKQILHGLHALRILAYKIDAGGKKARISGAKYTADAPPGLPDIVGVLPGGRALYVEVKRPQTALHRAGILSPAQEFFLEKLANAGALVIVAHSLTEVVAKLQEAGYA